MATKRYKSKVMSLSLPVVIDGKPRRLNFRGGVPGAGYYVTSDKKEQRAIESNARYGRSITLEGTYGKDESEETKVFNSFQAAEAPLNPVDEGSPAEENESADDGQAEDSVLTVQDAREWLINNKDAKASELTNKAAVLSFASAKGVVFPNLK